MRLLICILFLLLAGAVEAEVGDDPVTLRYPNGKLKKTTQRKQDTHILRFVKGKQLGKLQILEGGRASVKISKTARGVELDMGGKKTGVLTKKEATRRINYLFGRYELAMCQDNLKSLAQRLEKVYRKQKRYPTSLKALGRLPTCPSTEKDTYSRGFKCDGQEYRVTCKGGHTRADVPKGYPFFDFHRGLVVEPGREFPNKAPRH